MSIYIMFDPDSISQDDLRDLQRAAELAWGEDTRHPSFQLHPNPSFGQCYVTSRWLQHRLGGSVGERKGHFFWVSPDNRYVIDLTGDGNSVPPVDDSKYSDEDRKFIEPHRRRWNIGPALYVRSDHPDYRGFRIVDESPHRRSDIFSARADAHMRDGISKRSDLMGPTPYPGSTPQSQENWDQKFPILHDEPNSVSDPDQRYQFVIANGELYVSPSQDHERLLDHAGVSIQSQGPIAVGYADVDDGNATWTVTSNISLSNVHKMLEEYSDNMGWTFEGMVDNQGNPISDSVGPKASMWYASRPDGHLIMSKSPLQHGNRIDIKGRTASCRSEVGPVREALLEWANDFKYKMDWRDPLVHMAEVPGGSQMTDLVKVMPYLDQHNLGDQDAEPDKELGDLRKIPYLTCGTCGKKFEDVNDLILHSKDHYPMVDTVPEERFPRTPFDRDQQVDFGTSPDPASSDGISGG